MSGWLLTLPAAGLVGALATLVILWVGPWGLLLDAAVAGGIVVYLYVRSLATRVDHSNAVSDVAESGNAVDIKGQGAKAERRDRA